MHPYAAFVRLASVMLTVLLALGVVGCSTVNEMERESAGAAADEMPEPMSSGEILYVIEAINQGEAEQAELALQHSQNSQVDEVARLILEDHAASSRELDELAQAMDADAESTTVSEGMKFQFKASLEDMAGLTGYEFNKTYLQKQVELHGVALDVVQTQLLPNSDEQEVIDFLEDYRDMLEMHREHAQESLREVL